MVLNRISTERRTPEDVCLASVNQLKHLVLTFRTRYNCATTSVSWHNALLYVANTCLPTHQGSLKGNRLFGQESSGSGTADLEDSHGRTWFLACIDSYRGLAPQFTIFKSIMQGLLSIAMQRGLISTTEGRSLMDEINTDMEQSTEYYRQHSEHLQDEQPWQMECSGDTDLGDTSGLPDRTGRNTFVVDLNTAVVDLDAASVDALIRTFEGIAMLDEFTTETTQEH